MNPLTVSATAVATILLIALVVVLIFRRPRPFLVPPAAPPTATPAAPSPPDPFEEEWESLAPYPDYARRPARPSAPHHPAHDYRTATAADIRHRSAFTSDGLNLSEPHEEPQPRYAEPFPQPDNNISMFRPPLATDPPYAASGGASLGCPQCGSMEISTLNVARIAGSTIGSVAGATSGFAMALSGAEAGAAVGAIGGPIGAVFGGFTGAVLAGLLGSAAGNAAGSALGAAIDENMLDNYRCLSCGHTFGALHG